VNRFVRGALGGAFAVAVLGSLALVAIDATRAPSSSRRSWPPARTQPSVEVMPWSWQEELAFYQPPSPLPPAPPGTLIRIQRLAPNVDVPPGTVAWRILYHSEAPDGHDIAVSGLFFAPRGRPPPGGWPLVAVAHATTGLAPACAPSRFADLSAVVDLPELLAAGYAVVATDYPSLGTPGVHPYLVGRSEGESVLDAALAARQIPGVEVARRVALLGYSQGGHAVLFAAQLAATGMWHGLEVVAAIALAPAVSLPAELAYLDTNPGFDGLLLTLAVAWQATYPDLARTGTLSPLGARYAPAALQQCELALQAALPPVAPGALLAPGLAANPAWRRHVEQNDPGHAPTSVPLLVASGTEDMVVPIALVAQFVARACASEHDRIETLVVPGANHATIVQATVGAVLAVLDARFAGHPAPRGCRTREAPVPGRSSPPA
jgi:alpha-beta hydrolase superfamily lysophospholipase